MKENNKGNGNTIAIILITIILLTLIGVFAYFTMSRMDKMENSTLNSFKTFQNQFQKLIVNLKIHQIHLIKKKMIVLLKTQQ